MLVTKIFAAAALAVFSASGAAIEEKAAPSQEVVADLGPAIGAAIPHNLELPTANGDTADFEMLSGENGLALFFVRSVDWCPFCKKQAIEVSEHVTDFEARGLNVALFSYDTARKQKDFVEKSCFKPVLLSDEKIEAINAFGLRNDMHAEGSRFYGIPHPAVFIIDSAGVITAKFYESDFMTNDKSYRNRPAVDLILEQVDALAANEAAD